MKQSQNKTSSSGAQRMGQSSSTTVGVGSFAIETDFLLDGEVLSRKSFVDFNQIHIREFQAGFFQRLTGGRHRAYAHEFRLDAGVSPTNDAPDWFKVFRLYKLFARNQQRGRAVDDARSISTGPEPRLPEARTQLAC